MTGEFNIDFAIIPDEIYTKKETNKEDWDYINDTLTKFDWKSLQRLPEKGETIFFLGKIDFMIQVGDIWTTFVDGKYYKREGLWYTIYITHIDITKRNS